MPRPGPFAAPGLLASALGAVRGLAGGPAAAAAADDPRALWRENRRLAAEVGLARGPKSYFVLDLAARRAALRARGMTLAEWPIELALLWGRRPPIAATSLVRKDALPRPAIVPGEEKSLEKLDAQILEVKVMPSAYRVGLEGDVEIQVLPAPGPALRERLLHAAKVLRWRLARPLQTLRERRSRRETTHVLVVLRPEAARAVPVRQGGGGGRSTAFRRLRGADR